LIVVALVGGLLLAIKWQAGRRFVDSDQIGQEDGFEAALEPGQPVGQTFVARHAGLSGVEFYLLPENSVPLSLTLHLRADPQSTTDLATASLELPLEASPGFYRFVLPPLDSSHGQYYYAFLDTPESGVSVALASGATYLDGAAYQAHEPLDAQATFRLVYMPGLVILDLLEAGFGWVGLLAVAGLLFVVPGWALLAWLLPGGGRLTWAEMLGLAVGVSLAIYPLLLLWTDLVGLRLGALYAWIPSTLGLAALVWRYHRWRPRQGWDALQRWAHSEAFWPDLTLLFVLAMVFGVRFLVVRTLAAPMWGDSYQHTMMAQLLADSHGLFDSWGPYAEMETFTYHFGFHSAVAVLYWLTKVTVVQATIWTGQLLNGLAVLTLYLLAVRITRSLWSGVWAVLLAGLLSSMPMFYVNWGRYTQLAGLAILPAAVWLVWEAVEAPKRHWRTLALAALVGGGLALTHYRVLLFYGVFLLALALTMRRRETFIRLGCIILGAGALVLPWYVGIFEGYLAGIVGYYVTTAPNQAGSFASQYNTIGRLDTYLAPVWWLALLVGLGAGLWHRERNALVMGLWWFLLLVATNPAWISLPGTGMITNFAVFIAVYIPASMFSAILVSYLARPIARRRWMSPMLALVLAILSVWGARQRLGDPDPQRYALVTHPDVRAATWIREHTPLETRFLINHIFEYAGNAVVGTDAGWWLPLLAGRQNTVPPLTYSFELGREPDYRRQVSQLAHQLREHHLDDPELLDLLGQQGVTHVYLGQQQGQVSNLDKEGFEPEQLEASPNYRKVYHEDRVWIFEIIK
jgi:hypothetical protein